MNLFRGNVSRGNGGFTIIEVLVVAAIIGILAAIIFANFDTARKQSRDKVRKSDLKQLQLSMELYKSQNGSYPASISSLAPDYLPDIPTDPSGGSYSYNSDGSSYKIMTTGVESQYVTSFADEFARCPRVYTTNCPNVSAIRGVYAVYPAGAEDW